MTDRNDFATRIHDLERAFAAAAAVDRDVYLPNFRPSGPVDAILIAMEPSLGRWAPTPAKAAKKIAEGFRNFMWSAEDFILHYAVRRSLRSANWTYHITDISKGAMTVDKANLDRSARYGRWAPLLDEEIRLVAKPTAHIIAIGGQVGRLLKRRNANRNVTCIMHYAAWASSRDAAVNGREAEYRAFADGFSINDIVEVAEEVMRENSIPGVMSAETIARLRKANWSESRTKLAFIYTTAFANLH